MLVGMIMKPVLRRNHNIPGNAVLARKVTFVNMAQIGHCLEGKISHCLDR